MIAPFLWRTFTPNCDALLFTNGSSQSVYGRQEVRTSGATEGRHSSTSGAGKTRRGEARTSF